MSLNTLDDTEPPAPPPLSDTAIGAMLAFLRVLDLYDPAVAHRSAIRAQLADRLASRLDVAPSSRALAIATAAMIDVDLTITRPPAEDAPRSSDRSTLAATLVERIPTLAPLAGALHHLDEHWDGTGEPDGLTTTDIPVEARIAAVCDALVGNPATGFLPTWEPALQRAVRRRGTHFDPAVIDAAASIDLHGLSVPVIASTMVAELLQAAAPPVALSIPTTTASEVAAAVGAAGSVDDLLQLFADVALRSSAAANVSILRLTKTSIDDAPAAEANDGEEPIVTPDRLVDITEFSTVAELRAGQPVIRTDTDEIASIRDRMRELELSSEITVPIIVQGSAWGVVSAARRATDPPLDDHSLELLTNIAAEAARSLGITLRWERIEDMALRDSLTGLSNRHVLYDVLDGIFERDAVDRQDCAVIMCDVDGLKDINDVDGHAAGDRLLIDAAHALRSATRDPDRTTICRIGGDEFCMVIDGGALLSAHEISDTIERLYERSAPPGSSRSISCGIAFADSSIETRSQLLRAADEHQYQTKRVRRAARGVPISDAPRRAGDRRAIRD